MDRRGKRYTGLVIATVISLILGAVAVPLAWANSFKEAPAVGFGMRMDLLTAGNTKALLNAAQVMRADWVAQNVKWKDIESEPGQYNWAKLDTLLLTMRPYGIRLLITISGTPDWARPEGSDLNFDGPPTHTGTFTHFLSVMVTRYEGVVAAYEIWPEANIRSRWWTAEGVSPEAYVNFVQQAAQAIHTADPMSLVISGGLAPTGANDGFNVIDDLTFYQRMYAAGLKNDVDGLGVRVDGYNNPPADTTNSSTVTTTTYKGDTSFYFRHYEDVRAIMVANGADDQSIWLTSAGWASASQPAQGQEYAADVSEQQQADYLVEALMQIQSQPYIAAIMVNNFNLSTVASTPAELVPYSLIRTDWSARPAFVSLAKFRQGDIFSAPVAAGSLTPEPHLIDNWRPRIRYAFQSSPP
jgi:polysaccharide biosynthesis protein PslG